MPTTKKSSNTSILWAWHRTGSDLNEVVNIAAISFMNPVTDQCMLDREQLFTFIYYVSDLNNNEELKLVKLIENNFVPSPSLFWILLYIEWSSYFFSLKSDYNSATLFSTINKCNTSK